MKRPVRLAAAVSSAAVLLIAIPSVATPAAASPPDITTWFASLTPDQVMPYVQSLPTWSGQGGSDSAALSFGSPAPTLGYTLPGYDLTTNAVTGTAQLNKGLTPTGGCCARALVDQKPIDIVVCADPTSDGSSYQVSVASEVQFLDTSPDLPAGGTTGPDHNFIGVQGGAVVPLDQSAQTWLGTSKLDGSTFVRLAAQQKAELAAIDRINGPAMGGGIPLIGGNQADVAAFEASVAQGSGIPVSRLSHPQTVNEAEATTAPAHHSTWMVPVVALAGLMTAVLAATLRRHRRPATNLR